ncbi:acylneuraminate cytidylyltransferase family protein [Marivirga arenosa]|uniref:Acylneuraminate cytidylyltransferase family protein n=1 Tax=Marivirga arenosa TaxID=3059076 RepID=A0AA51X4I9_9BACT|nr:acylneuraminate cytidylyltransferase family protein [Marivirga sp. BKB1-2]WNB16860.1 acylneuraminate cytidylyltransferase family protein [Marivirga sp. BKB1-2]
MNNQVTFFLPIRKGSQRVKNKNTRTFAGIEGGLVRLKLEQLLKSTRIDQIVLSTNDEVSMEIAKNLDSSESKIKVVPRPEELCLDITSLSELIKYVPTIIKKGHILWGHATTPFATAEVYDQVVDQYFNQIKNGYDSLITILELQNFILNKEAKIINYEHSEGKWPRTQDLPVLYEVNHAVFMTSRVIYLNNLDRIGSKPYLFTQNKIESFDIDWEEDFLIAEAIYDKLYRN